MTRIKKFIILFSLLFCLAGCNKNNHNERVEDLSNSIMPITTNTRRKTGSYISFDKLENVNYHETSREGKEESYQLSKINCAMFDYCYELEQHDYIKFVGLNKEDFYYQIYYFDNADPSPDEIENPGISLFGELQKETDGKN